VVEHADGLLLGLRHTHNVSGPSRSPRYRTTAAGSSKVRTAFSHASHAKIPIGLANPALSLSAQAVAGSTDHFVPKLLVWSFGVVYGGVMH